MRFLIALQFGRALINGKNHLQVKSFILGLALLCTTYEGKFSAKKMRVEINSTIRWDER